MTDPARKADQAARLVASTGRRLYITSLLLIALLIVGIGVTTGLAALGALDADVDRALEATARTALGRLDGELPVAQESDESAEVAPASADTFVLYVSPTGEIVSDPSRVALPGLPVAAALSEASRVGTDLRTVELGGVSVRLETLPIGPPSRPTGFVQAGFVLTLHDAQSTSLVVAIALVGVVGLLGAALVTLLVVRRALDPIRRSFAAQLRFVADASHELRTPATIIRATAEVLTRESLVMPDGGPLLADIVAESDRLGRLVGDLLMLSTSGAADLALERTAVDLPDLLRDTVRRVVPLADEKRVDVVVDVVGTAIIDGDRDRLVQLVLILVDNAIDHAPAGTSVEVALRRRGGSVLLSVTDRGPGIPAEERERVFAPFARLPSAASERREGAGLGLAIARRIAEAHGGTIVAQAGPGGGARLEVTLPVRG